MANIQDKLVKHGWFKKPLGIAAPVVQNGTDNSSPCAVSSVPAIRDLKLDLGGKALETNDQATNDIVAAALNLMTPTRQVFQPTNGRGIFNKTNIQDGLLKVGWTKKTNEVVIYGLRSTDKVEPVSEGTENLEVWLNNYHEGKLSQTSDTKSTVGNDVAGILEWVQRKEQTVSPRKRQQVVVEKAELRKNLLSKGWYSTTGSLPVKTNTNASVSLEGEGEYPAGVDIGHDVRKLDGDMDGKPEYVEQILNMVSRKKRLSHPAKHRGAMSKTELREHLLLKGWYRQADNFPSKPDEDTNFVINPDCLHDEHFADPKGTSVDKKENISCSEGQQGESNEHISKDETKDVHYNCNIADPEGKYADDIAEQKLTPTDNNDIEGTSTGDINRTKTTIKENLADPESKSDDIKDYNATPKLTDHDICNFWKEGEFDRFGDRRTKRPEFQPNQSNFITTTVDKPAEISENNDNMLLDDQDKSESKYEDEKSKKSNPHEKEINSLLQEGWTMVKPSRYQVTLVKLPEREHHKTCITEPLSESDGSKETKPGNDDVETKVTDSSNNTARLRRFLRRSRKMLRRMFTCGRSEE
ncbi:hypothetical protein LOTGIDRAFT_231305 [Lottia gigantea]|uniref:Uncharacterized protein n=1 Tax=Lottia gigantea TaxID=225164 RepID=V4A513_LOTGI|nr:hypothetical protein LOTGIDRAFT_231305 [Lottia gigantea]ESO98988.1 hypothetical protein LOTGIDRAFT_231305 [Lottia gigantea]